MWIPRSDPSREALRPPMVILHTRQIGDKWFGVAYAPEGLVATAVSTTRARAEGHLRRSLPRGVAHGVAEEDRSDLVERAMALLVELEAGREEHKTFTLATAHVGAALAAVLKVAAAIPLGYVTSYGNIAGAAGAEAREVGRVMASNPLYPIVPCHRVVGSDLSLVGYGGSTGKAALRAKLARLAKEARGFEVEKDVLVEGRPLRVYPVERVLAHAEKHGPREDPQGRLFE
jgi:O-6-methylguanine DNA methyltransferase